MKRLIVCMAVTGSLLLPSCQPGREAAKPPVRLGADVQSLAEEILTPLAGPVTITLIRGGKDEIMGEQSQALVEMVAAVAPEVTVTILDISTVPGTKDLGVTRGPVIEMKGKAPGTLRYYGFPERKETRPFFEGILSASGHPPDLPPDVRSYITELDEEVWIRIFTTPE